MSKTRKWNEAAIKWLAVTTCLIMMGTALGPATTSSEIYVGLKYAGVIKGHPWLDTFFGYGAPIGFSKVLWKRGGKKVATRAASWAAEKLAQRAIGRTIVRVASGILIRAVPVVGWALDAYTVASF